MIILYGLLGVKLFKSARSWEFMNDYPVFSPYRLTRQSSLTHQRLYMFLGSRQPLPRELDFFGPNS